MALFGVADYQAALAPVESIVSLHYPHRRSFVMSRAVLIVLMALFTLSFTPVSYADPGSDGDGVVWGT